MKYLLQIGWLHFCFATIMVNAQNPYTIPVVVHVLHMGGNENISDVQVVDGMAVLNQDYRKLNADTSQVIAPFSSNMADMEIEFCLASIDPNGNPTNGIEHVMSSFTNDGSNPAAKINQWPPDQYFNIWVVADMAPSVAAFAISPDAAELFPSQDGLVIRHDYMGRIGTSAVYTGRFITPNTGTYLGLKATFADSVGTSSAGTCGDDEVADTPITNAIYTCDLTADDCNPPIVQNVQNFMAFGYCGRMFTNGQKTRVHDAMNSSVAGRNNLWSASNLTLTGCGVPNSIAENAPASVSVYPNPATSSVTITGLKAGENMISIYDVMGKLIYSKGFASNGGLVVLNIGALKISGVYLMKISSDEFTGTLKLIKE